MYHPPWLTIMAQPYYTARYLGTINGTQGDRQRVKSQFVEPIKTGSRRK